MFAKYIYVQRPDLEESVVDTRLLFEPLHTLKQVYSGLATLNGEDINTLVVAEAPADPEDDEKFWKGDAMLIHGGRNNAYICRAWVDKKVRSPLWGAFHHGAERTDETVLVRAGHREEVPKYKIIGIGDARKALKAFVQRGELSDTFSWEAEFTL